MGVHGCPWVSCVQHQVVSEQQPNTESVGELWLGLLRFYTEEFDFKEHVISIRQKKRLTTFEKQWTSKCIAIEGAAPAPASRPPSRRRLLSSNSSAPPSDPFDLNHNLGAGVSRKSELCPSVCPPAHEGRLLLCVTSVTSSVRSPTLFSQ